MSIDDEARSGAAAYYAERLARFGGGPQAMDWRDHPTQWLRFDVLTRHLELAAGGGSIADLGCGDGELLAFLRARGREPGRYLGFDVASEMVAACRRRFGGESAVHGSTDDLPAHGPFDFVVASGTFNVKQEASDGEWRPYVERSVAAMYAACRVATAFNLMSTRVDWRRDHLHYWAAEEAPALAALCGTRRFLIDHAYPLHEMTVVLYR